MIAAQRPRTATPNPRQAHRGCGSRTSRFAARRAGIQRARLRSRVTVKNNHVDATALLGVFSGFRRQRHRGQRGVALGHLHGIYASNSADRPVIRFQPRVGQRAVQHPHRAVASARGCGVISGFRSSREHDPRPTASAAPLHQQRSITGRRPKRVLNGNQHRNPLPIDGGASAPTRSSTTPLRMARSSAQRSTSDGSCRQRAQQRLARHPPEQTRSYLRVVHGQLDHNALPADPDRQQR